MVPRHRVHLSHRGHRALRLYRRKGRLQLGLLLCRPPDSSAWASELDHAGELGTLFPKLNPEGKRLVLERLQNISGVVVVNPGPQQMTDAEENELPLSN